MSFRASDIEIVASGLVPKDRTILTTQQSKQFLTTLCRAITEQLRGEGARLRRVLENQELVHISNIRWPRKSSLFTREPKALVDFVTLLTRRGEQLQQVSARAAREWEEVLFE